jgi:hypothetical protein
MLDIYDALGTMRGPTFTKPASLSTSLRIDAVTSLHECAQVPL